MSINDTHDIDDETTKLPDDVPASSVSRRTLMKTAAGVGVAAAAVGVVGVASAASTPSGAGNSGAQSGTTHTSLGSAGPVVVHVTDFGSGTLEVFNGWTRTQVTDRDLATRIARAAKA